MFYTQKSHTFILYKKLVSMGLFNRFKLDIKPLTKEPVTAFSNHFKKMASLLADNKLSSKSKMSSVSTENFKKLWGAEMPNGLRNVFEQLAELGTPKFQNWESNIPSFNIANHKGNIVKDVLLKAQVEFPTDYHINWFTGTISLDPVVNNTKGGYSQHYSYQYPLYDTIPAGKTQPQIYTYQHNNQDTWGINFEIMAEDVSSFLYVVMMIQAYKKKKISNADFLICYDKIKAKVKLPYYFFNSFRADGRWVNYYDFNYRKSNVEGASLSLDHFNRARWIIELLKGNHNNYLWTIQNNLYNQVHNPVITKEIHEANLRNLPNHVPDALYYLLRCFFRNETEQLEAYIDVCKSSQSKIISDAALFAEELNDGLEFFGEIDNIQELKRDFAKDKTW
ncbi:MAG: hypothetical protein ACI94Y_002017 [Maribacter sp.]